MRFFHLVIITIAFLSGALVSCKEPANDLLICSTYASSEENTIQEYVHSGIRTLKADYNDCVEDLDCSELFALRLECGSGSSKVSLSTGLVTCNLELKENFVAEAELFMAQSCERFEGPCEESSRLYPGDPVSKCLLGNCVIVDASAAITGP